MCTLLSHYWKILLHRLLTYGIIDLRLVVYLGKTQSNVL